jgi:ElaB/YqjD/DUF883 family membrane-anchored ribosome-binding protein
MYSNSVQSLPTIDSYEAAQAYFANKAKPPRSKRWAEHERPLRNTRLHHYRIEHHTQADGQEWYDVVLYRTPMARYYKPEGSRRRVLLNGSNTNLSNQFRWSVLRYGRRFNTQAIFEGMEYTAIVPIHVRNTITDKGEQFCVDMWFDDYLLDVKASQHTRHYTRKSSDEDKQQRKDVKQAMQGVLLMACMKLHEYERNAVINTDYVYAFSNEATPESAERWAMQMFVDGDFNQDALDSFLQTTAQKAYNSLASWRAKNEGKLKSARDMFKWTNYQRQATGVVQATVYDLEQRVTEKDLETRLWDTIKRHTSLCGQSEAVELPQFADVLPKSNITTYP